MIINADLHVHSKYSMATSKNMNPETMAIESMKKGLNLIATGDALHSKWLEELEDQLTPMDDTGIYKTNIEGVSTNFITTTEVEDNERIHHLLIIPSLEVAWQMRDEFTDRVMSRIMRNYEIIPLYGEDIRVRQKLGSAVLDGKRGAVL